ncbi:uncharacterized protein LOC142544424 [Primulina tabacum]|uniref:uncharacterized protein LOC142544424 n=1 Tax=Primulina tabacum TaxID=48773 RepID=UPI003F595F64
MDTMRGLLYVGGYVIIEDGRVGYSIPATRTIKISRSITFSQLVNFVHRKLDIDPSKFCIKLSTKYCYSSLARYNEEHVYITDDDSLQFMFELPTLDCMYLSVDSSPVLQNVSDYDFDAVIPVITQGLGTVGLNEARPSMYHIDEQSGHTYSGIDTGPWDHHITADTEEDYARGMNTTREWDFTSRGWDHHITGPSGVDVAWGSSRTGQLDANIPAPITEHMPEQDDLFGDSSHHVMNSDDDLYATSSDGEDDHHVDNANEGTSARVLMSGATMTENIPIAPEQHLREIPQFFNEVYHEQIPDSFGIPSASRTNFYNPERPELGVKMVFNRKGELIASVKDFSVRVLRREYIVVESSPTIWKVKCKNWSEGGNCGWGLRASFKKILGYFMITKYGGDHTCMSTQVGIDHHNIDVNMIANTLLGIVRCDPAYEIKMCAKSLKRAVELVYGTWESSVTLLPKYMGALSKYNPGTVVEWKHLRPYDHPHKVLNFVFWVFRPCIDGFRHCRNVISVDGTHMYTKYKHKLLIAVTLDANNQVLPLAFALVDEENYESWHWFLGNVARHVTRGCSGVCLISDRHAGITSAVQDLPDFKPPLGVHRFCLRHVCSNFNSRFKNIHLKDLCWEVEIQHQVSKFNATMEAIKTNNAAAFTYLSNIPKEKWSLAHDGGWRRGIMTTNMSECINAKWFGLNPAQLVQPWFTLSEYVNTYDGRFYPMMNNIGMNLHSNYDIMVFVDNGGRLVGAVC